MNCPNCNTKRPAHFKGTRRKKGNVYKRMLCRECKRYFNVAVDTQGIETLVKQNKKKPPLLITASSEFTEKFPHAKGIVVTSCLNDTAINHDFFNSLKTYCEQKDFALVVIPIKYLFGTEASWPAEIQSYLLHTTLRHGKQFKIIGDCNIQATASHPLTSIDGLCEGMTTVVGHPVLQFKTVPVNEWRDPIILSSTGCISVKTQYSASKAGYRASFHHCFSACVIELDEDQFHIRHLLADNMGGFADLNEYWTGDGMTKTTVDAIVFGDEHVIFCDDIVYSASFYAKDSMTHVLKPRYMIRHDVFDAISCGKHDVNNFFNRFKKHQKDYKSVEYELAVTLDHIVDSTPEFATSLIVSSNHHDHLDQWLCQYGDPKNDYVNCELYYNLMWRKLKDIRGRIDRSSFQIFAEDIYGLPVNVQFMPDGFSLHDIQLSRHFDRGPNGARGSVGNLSKIGEKNVGGHSHSPAWQAGTVVVGTSSKKNLDYTKGSPSSWLHTHCVIHKNGKRQLINIINGKWRKGS